MLGRLAHPIAVFHARARRGAGVDADRPTHGSTVVGQLVQHNLPATGGYGNRIDQRGVKQVTADRVTAAAREVEPLIAGDGRGKRSGSDISKEPYRIPGQFL